MTSDPVSIIVPTYNRAGLIGRALSSLVPQCLPGDEIIVVDDGSSDDTEQVVSTFAGVRFVRADHGGAGRARNLGVELSSRPLVAFLDSDDELLPGSLACRRALMDARRDLVFAFTEFAGQYADGRRVPSFAIEWHRDPRSWDVIIGPGERLSTLIGTPHEPDPMVHIGSMYLRELSSNYISVNALLVRRDLAGDALRFAGDLPIYEDWECFGRLAARGPCAFMAFDSYVQHEHQGPRLTDSRIDQRVHARLTMLERVWGRDAAFLADHRAEFEAECDAQRLLGARWMLLRRRGAEARALLAPVRRRPLWATAALAVPGVDLALSAWHEWRQRRVNPGASPDNREPRP